MAIESADLTGEDVMDNLDEIKDLLREIRDLQKAHFERYKEFTQAMLDRQQANKQDVERARTEQSRFREETRGFLKASRERADSNTVVIVAIIIGIAVLSLGGGLLALAFRLWGP